MLSTYLFRYIENRSGDTSYFLILGASLNYNAAYLLSFLPSFPAGWLRFKDKCFMFKGKKDDVKANWSHARSWCKDQGGELAVIDDQYENDFVSSYLRDLELPTWIGLSDLLSENQYAWSDGVSPVRYTNWNDKEPNNAGGAEHCVAMSHSPLVSGKWNDDACHKDHSFVCYRKKCQSTPSPHLSS
uniref:C-type lectin domain-containing protein n=1 Tax=Scophthalmus maximus TaxID=52904 RepID=A0A8D3CX63_SCOMX